MFPRSLIQIFSVVFQTSVGLLIEYGELILCREVLGFRLFEAQRPRMVGIEQLKIVLERVDGLSGQFSLP